MNNSLLIIGRPASGKSVYLAQFLTRVRKKKSRIKLLKSPDNIKAISDVQKSLSEGKEPSTTAADSNQELLLPLIVNDREIQLRYPDYGGEQVNSLMQSMAVEERWQDYVDNSDSWMIFIRPSYISSNYDLTISSYEGVYGAKSNKSPPPELSDQSQYIELVQALLFSKNIGVKQKVFSPRLTIVLTCWDEVMTDNTPKELIAEKLPLFLNFIESHWEENNFAIFGLSAQEFTLRDNFEGSEKYLDELPENLGYLVFPDGQKDRDITKLVEQALS